MTSRNDQPIAVLSREELYHKNLKREMKRQDDRRYIDPDAVEAAPRVWVAYTLVGGVIVLAGFFRTRKLKLPKLKKIRKRLKLAEDQLLHLVDLFTAAKEGVHYGRAADDSDRASALAPRSRRGRTQRKARGRNDRAGKHPKSRKAHARAPRRK